MLKRLSHALTKFQYQLRRLKVKSKLVKPRHIASYAGYANHNSVFVFGRLLGDKPEKKPGKEDSVWKNIRATFRRWETDEIPDAKILLRYLSQEQSVTTNSQGYYQTQFALDPQAKHATSVTASYIQPKLQITSSHAIAYLHPAAQYMIISDVDDTIIHTGITDLLTAARLTFLRNATTREPLPGVAELYQTLVRGTQQQAINPIFYLSKSAWNMYTVLENFLLINKFPSGPLLLRDIGLGANSANHKMQTLRKLLTLYPDLPVILIGDSGQHDAKYYSSIAAEYPGRVTAIYVRDVDPDVDSEYDLNVDKIIQKTQTLGVPFLRVQDSDQILQHAISMGFVENPAKSPSSKLLTQNA